MKENFLPSEEKTEKEVIDVMSDGSPDVEKPEKKRSNIIDQMWEFSLQEDGWRKFSESQLAYAEKFINRCARNFYYAAVPIKTPGLVHLLQIGRLKDNLFISDKYFSGNSLAIGLVINTHASSTDFQLGHWADHSDQSEVEISDIPEMLEVFPGRCLTPDARIIIGGCNTAGITDEYIPFENIVDALSRAYHRTCIGAKGPASLKSVRSIPSKSPHGPVILVPEYHYEKSPALYNDGKNESDYTIDYV